MRYFDKFWWIFLLLILLPIKKMGSDMSFKLGLSNHLGIYLFGSQCDSTTGHIRTCNWIMEVNFQLLFNIGAYKTVYRVYVLYLHVKWIFSLVINKRCPSNIYNVFIHVYFKLKISDIVVSSPFSISRSVGASG